MKLTESPEKAIHRLFSEMPPSAQEATLRAMMKIYLATQRAAFGVVDPIAEYLKGEVERKR